VRVLADCGVKRNCELNSTMSAIFGSFYDSKTSRMHRSVLVSHTVGLEIECDYGIFFGLLLTCDLFTAGRSGIGVAMTTTTCMLEHTRNLARSGFGLCIAFTLGRRLSYVARYWTELVVPPSHRAERAEHPAKRPSFLHGGRPD
jgi:hypothetical protein